MLFRWNKTGDQKLYFCFQPLGGDILSFCRDASSLKISSANEVAVLQTWCSIKELRPGFFEQLKAVFIRQLVSPIKRCKIGSVIIFYQRMRNGAFGVTLVSVLCLGLHSFNILGCRAIRSWWSWGKGRLLLRVVPFISLYLFKHSSCLLRLDTDAKRERMYISNKQRNHSC